MSKFNKNGLAAGTLVHTDKGLLPIQELKIGDRVLSRHESGEGELVYKRVTQTYCSEDQPLVATVVADVIPDVKENYEFIFSSYTHSFAVKDKTNSSIFKWRSIDELIQGDELIGKDDESLYFGLIEDSVYLESAGNFTNFAFWRSPSTRSGVLLDFSDFLNRIRNYPIFGDENVEWLDDNYDENNQLRAVKPFLHSVYNLEVEDFHTYFVGEMGVWVK